MISSMHPRFRSHIDGGAYGNASSQGTDSTNVNFEHNLSALAEGVHYFSLQAADENATLATFGPVYFTIDRFAPSLAVTSPAASSSHNSAFSITGTASDTNGLATWDHDANGGTAEVPYVDIDAVNVEVTAGAWTYPVPEVFDGTGDGVQNYTLAATDLFGKATVISFAFQVDGTNPTVAVAAPLVTDWLSGSTYTANGTSSDVTSIISSVDVRIDANGDTDFADGGIEDWAPASGAATWTSVVALAGLGEGARNIDVRATDAAGNQATAGRSFGVDQSNPSTSVSAPSDASTTFTVSGTATDANELTNVTVTQSKDGGAAVEVLNTSLSGVSDPWSIPTMPNGGVATGVYESPSPTCASGLRICVFLEFLRPRRLSTFFRAIYVRFDKL